MTSQKCYYWSCDCVAMLLPLPPFDNQNRARRMSTIHNFFCCIFLQPSPKAMGAAVTDYNEVRTHIFCIVCIVKLSKGAYTPSLLIQLHQRAPRSWQWS